MIILLFLFYGLWSYCKMKMDPSFLLISSDWIIAGSWLTRKLVFFLWASQSEVPVCVTTEMSATMNTLLLNSCVESWTFPGLVYIYYWKDWVDSSKSGELVAIFSCSVPLRLRKKTHKIIQKNKLNLLSKCELYRSKCPWIYLFRAASHVICLSSDRKATWSHV